MAWINPDVLTRKGGETDRDRVRSRVALAIDARRRLSIQRSGTATTKERRTGPLDPRFDYLTQSYD